MNVSLQKIQREEADLIQVLRVLQEELQSTLDISQNHIDKTLIALPILIRVRLIGPISGR